MNEFEAIARFFSRPPRATSVHRGVGDDAALLAPTPGCELAVSVDMLVAGRHFLTDVDPQKLGHKTLAVNLSDLAAMGATPRWALLAGALPELDAQWLDAFARGFYALADRHDIELVGGDTTAGPLNLCVTVLGEVPAGLALTRDGAKQGDDVYVSGVIGDAALALAALTGRVKVGVDALKSAREKLETPVPRIALGIALRGIASAAIDVSDGLTGDLGHILEQSGAGADIELEAVPRSPELDRLLAGGDRSVALDCLLGGGDDYELCFAARPDAAVRVAQVAAQTGVALARIGTVTGERGLIVRDERGVPLPAVPHAFDHFASADAKR